MLKLVGKWAVGVSFLVFLVLEVWFAFDKSAFTWPLTQEIVTYLPYPVTAAILGWFVKWAPKHFDHAYQQEGTMKGFKVEPVKWMTVILGVLVSLEGVQEFVDLIPSKANGAILIAIAVLGGVLGVKVRGKVTPTAAPKDDSGRPLVPAGSAPVQPPPAA